MNPVTIPFIDAPAPTLLVERHRLLTFVGVGLLLATFALNHDYAINRGPDDFNMAYVTGAGMLAAFAASFGLFNFAHLRGKKGR